MFSNYRPVPDGYSAWIGDWHTYVNGITDSNVKVWECEHVHASRFDALECADKHRAMRRWQLVEA